MIYCDTPGFGDTRSAEIDCANCIAIYNALNSIHNKKKLVPIFFISCNSLVGNRGKNLKVDL